MEAGMSKKPSVDTTAGSKKDEEKSMAPKVDVSQGDKKEEEKATPPPQVNVSNVDPAAAKETKSGPKVEV